MKRLDRYVAAEVVAPTAVAFVAYTGLMLIRALFQFAELILQSAEPLRDTAFVLACSVPHIVVLTIPVSFLLGLLAGVGRLSADSELVALRAAGVDLVRLYRPIGLVAVVLWAVTTVTMLAAVPRANQLLYAKKLELSTFAIAQRIQPGVFSPEYSGRRIFVEEASPDRRTLRGVIVADRSDPGGGERLTLARAGLLELQEDEGRLWLRLLESTSFRVWDAGASDERAASPEQRILLVDTDPRQRLARTPFHKQLREQSVPELLVRAARTTSDTERRYAWVEVHKKFALPVACLVFGLLGLPLGVVNRRGGRAAGFAVSVGIVLVYYLVLSAGEAKAVDGSLSPWLSMWLPNVLLAAAGLVTLHRVRRDREAFSPPRFLSRHLLAAGRRLGAAAGRTRKEPERPRGPGRAFRPGSFLVDRYVGRRFLGLFALVLFSIVSLYIVIDFMEIGDDIAKNRPPISTLFRYAEARLAPVLQDVVPYAFLVAALVTMAGMVKSSESTALLAHGISLHRSAASLYLLAAGVGGLLLLFAERIVPSSAAEAGRLRETILGRPPRPILGGSQWLRGENGRFFTAADVDPERRTVAALTLVTIDPRSFRLGSRIDAARARWMPGRGFVIDEGWIRRYGSEGETLRGRLEPGYLVEAPEAEGVLLAGRLDPDVMTNAELARFIETRRRAGANVSRLETDLHHRFALGPASLLLTLLGLPYAFKFGKRGAVAGIGIAILIGLAFMAFASITIRLGSTGSLSPVLAAWGPNVLFGLWAAWGLLGVRT